MAWLCCCTTQSALQAPSGTLIKAKLPVTGPGPLTGVFDPPSTFRHPFTLLGGTLIQSPASTHIHPGASLPCDAE